MRIPIEEELMQHRNNKAETKIISIGYPDEDLRNEEDFHETDYGNAEFLVDAHGKDLHYCYPLRRWFVWDKRHWQEDQTGESERRAKDAVRQLVQENPEHGLKSEAATRIQAMLKLAKSEPGIPVLPKQLDQHPMLLNCRNGTIDLRTGELREHRREDLITKLCPVEYDKNAEAPIWTSFLKRVMDRNEEKTGFLQRLSGYSLSGDVSERVLIILLGKGRNGKTVVLETCRSILGPDYSRRTPTSTLLGKRTGMVPNDIARLRGARFVTASESDEGKPLDESTVKDLTGGDTLVSRHMAAEWFEFHPEFKLWLATNHRPIIRGADQGIWDRIILFPFNIMIPENEQDKHLIDKLRDELPGILAWAVSGCLKWQELGHLGIPDEVKTAVRKYRREMDFIGGFLDECCVMEPDAVTRSAELYESYKTWAEEKCKAPITQKRFGNMMTVRGIHRDRDSRTGLTDYHGIRLGENEGSEG